MIRAAHQLITREWWRHAPPRFRLVVSEAVVTEVKFGDANAAADRLQAIAGLPVLAINEDVRSLVQAYDTASLVPANARGDPLHFAFSVAFAAEYLVTWNCTHIANPHVVRKLTEINRSLGRLTPMIETPEASLARM